MSPEARPGALTIRTDYLARVEGEGAMYVRLEGKEVIDVELRIYEPPRFFEALLRGRAFTEAPDITSRICGICPIAYQLSAARAMEDTCGVAIDSGPIRDLRRLIYCGEWIESHSLHVYLLYAPDFLGYPGFVEMAREHPQIAEQGLRMKKAGNTRCHRGAARDALPPLRDRRRRHDLGRHDRPADLPEPARDRGGPARGRRKQPPAPRRTAQAALRAGDPQPRSLHLPPTVVVSGVEGSLFKPGAGLSAAVAVATEPRAAAVRREARAQLARLRADR